ncbi:PepSY domain-containing protein [Halotalea alkalilenta]|uniref:PepSY domain-containing protein n=1 Tax=Halotalea alkalilenta TaxID=376489 RepID=UPI00048697E4|nr:PepSY domain-containing protein [Halotalea alkalilenta]
MQIKPFLYALVIPATLGVSSLAQADGEIPYERLGGLLDQAEDFGFVGFEEISVDDRTKLEIEGWRADGWKLELDVMIDDGRRIKEAMREASAPAWALTRERLNAALEAGRSAGVTHFSQLEVDRDGYIEVEGRDDGGREIEVRLNSADFSVIRIERD